MPIRGSPNGANHLRPQAGRDRLEQVVAINRNAWSQSIGTAGRNHPVRAHALSPSQEPLPPYELDPMLDNPVIRNRIGELIAKAAEKRFGGWSLRCR
jgi:hypothetical protein